MSFILFILVNVVLFLRPAEIIPGLEGAPIYELVILAALAASAPEVLGQLTTRSLAARPVTVCVLGLLAAVVLSNLSHGALYEARTGGLLFFKIVLYYLLLVAAVDSPGLLRGFLGWTGVLILSLTTLAVLEYHGVINIASLEAVEQREVDPATGELIAFPRLCGMGIFNDPNDLSVILVVGMMISLSRLGERGGRRWLWLVPMAVMGYAFALTYSRGGLLALLFALLALFVARFGLRKGLFLVVVLLPVLLVVGGRQTRLDLGNKDDTSQHRVRLWRDGLVLMQASPVFGIGMGRYEEEVGLVAHNSFVHAYTELGLYGGTLFVGAFLFPLGVLYRVGSRKGSNLDPTLRALGPCVLACTAGMVAGMLSLSRLYTLTPYLVLGVVTVYLRLAATAVPAAVPRLTSGLAGRLVLLSLLCLAGLDVFVRLFAGTD
jgi:O-antigen ligase